MIYPKHWSGVFSSKQYDRGLKAFRMLPIVTLIEKTRAKITDFFHKRNLEGNLMAAPVTP